MQKGTFKSSARTVKPGPRPTATKAKPNPVQTSKTKPSPGANSKTKTPWTIDAARRIYSATSKKDGQIEKNSFAAEAMSKAMKPKSALIKKPKQCQ